MCVWYEGSVEAAAAPQRPEQCVHARAQQQHRQCRGVRPKLVRTNEPRLPDRSEDFREVVVKKEDMTCVMRIPDLGSAKSAAVEVKEEAPETSKVSEVVTAVDPKKEVVAADTSSSTTCNIH